MNALVVIGLVIGAIVLGVYIKNQYQSSRAESMRRKTRVVLESARLSTGTSLELVTFHDGDSWTWEVQEQGKTVGMVFPDGASAIDQMLGRTDVEASNKDSRRQFQFFVRDREKQAYLMRNSDELVTAVLAIRANRASQDEVRKAWAAVYRDPWLIDGDPREGEKKFFKKSRDAIAERAKRE